MTNSDKNYWHRYTEEYEMVFKENNHPINILELGIFRGESIKWLIEKFPNSNIFGADILDIQEEWPRSNKVKYFHVDQGEITTIKKLFSDIAEELDLIIEDGSHRPQHQKNCFIEGIKHLTDGGIYILEDLHTSHPSHSHYQEHIIKTLPLYIQSFLSILKKIKFTSLRKLLIDKFIKNKQFFGPLHLLLYFEQKLKLNIDLEETQLIEISKNSLFSKEEILFLYEKIKFIKIYRRSTLPLKCYSCGNSNFNYNLLKCSCGADVYAESDSISAIIKTKENVDQ
jgi:hypothetical protein